MINDKNEEIFKAFARVFVALKARFGNKFPEADAISDIEFKENWTEPAIANDVDPTKLYEDCIEYINKYWSYSVPPNQMTLIYFHLLCKKGKEYKNFIIKLKSKFGAKFIDHSFSENLYETLKSYELLDIDFDLLLSQVSVKPANISYSPSVTSILYDAIVVKHNYIAIPIESCYNIGLDNNHESYNNALLKEVRKRIGGFNLRTLTLEKSRKLFVDEYCNVLLELNSGNINLEDKKNNESIIVTASKEENTAFLSDLIQSRRNAQHKNK